MLLINKNQKYKTREMNAFYPKNKYNKNLLLFKLKIYLLDKYIIFYFKYRWYYFKFNIIFFSKHNFFLNQELNLNYSQQVRITCIELNLV